jgi:hypothetical protein
VKNAVSITTDRARAVSEENFKSWFNLVKTTYEDKGIVTAAQVLNGDETSLCDPKLREHFKVVCPKGMKAFFAQPKPEAEHVSYLPTICADQSIKVPPLYIFQGKDFMDNYIQAAEQGAAMLCTQSGGMEKEYFNQYIDHIGNYLKQTPLFKKSPNTQFILFIDRASVHLSLSALQNATNKYE